MKSIDYTEKISQNNNFFIDVAKKGFALAANPHITQKMKSQNSKVYLLLTPLYNNLGDHAITIAAQKWIEQLFPDYELIEVTSNYYKNFRSILLKNIDARDILMIVGGGFMGDMWMTMEYMVRDIICSFKTNKIIVLPQTVYFNSDTEKHIACELYRSHPDLHIMVRDMQSYHLCKQEMGLSHVYFLPDIVCTLTYTPKSEKQKAIGVCLREDKESLHQKLDSQQIQTTANHYGWRIINFSTLIKSPYIIACLRERLVKKKLDEIASYNVVITDRLHCMLFAYISNTPCIALDNKSKKVSGVYKWIQQCNYIKLYNPAVPLVQQIENVTLLKSLYKEQTNFFNLFQDAYNKIFEKEN